MVIPGNPLSSPGELPRPYQTEYKSSWMCLRPRISQTATSAGGPRAPSSCYRYPTLLGNVIERMCLPVEL